ncbi:Sedlin, N-terminal conserved region-domain-containing protein [Halteromyces radiatus]|uniref:Sedlin, N-terminal conserved region-domain-containing protein n=1 Tax=Halteromyces radiatus TaxID=101107 RepID=UPI00221F3B82|nr:Sedlin, N-terminal conserved region-domain-containing protein [Halteromyces radiatus]KAI8099230.1 Sedlin, N-terminal conserved region-domain-containing protein [Halteromyces radiatus]
MNSDISCIAIIGKQNNPLFIKNFSSTHPDLKYHYIAHTSIDIIEERVTNGPKQLDLYLGLLYAMEDLAVYGYMTNTKVKFIVVISVTDGVIRDTDMKAIFRKIHQAYVSHVCNPFYTMDSQNTTLSSPHFLHTIESINTTINTTQNPNTNPTSNMTVSKTHINTPS